MGWLSKHMSEGGRKGGNARKTRETCKHPLRKILWVVRYSTSIFEPDWVRFECGHEGSAWGSTRGRCRQCPTKD